MENTFFVFEYYILVSLSEFVETYTHKKRRKN